MIKFFSAALSAVSLLLFSLPVAGTAATRYVTLSTCPTTTVDYCFTNVGDAITKAAANDTIEIHPGTYQGNFSVTGKNLNFHGIETATTILTGGGAGAVLTLDSVTSSSIRKLTFANAPTGVVVQNSGGVEITNSIIEDTTTGVLITASPTTEIINNTFYRNTKAIDSGTTTSITIVNNIFSQLGLGATAISPATADLTVIRNNLFYGDSVGPPVILVNTDPAWQKNIGTNQDPLFVNPGASALASRDFHLKATSPAINAGDTVYGLNRVGDTTKTDIGAYGGNFADTIPNPVTGLTSSVSGSIITLNWTGSLDYAVTGYNVYTTSTGTFGSAVNAGLVTTYSFTQPAVMTAPTGTPVLSNTFSSGTLILLWDASSVTGATGYEVRYGTSSPPAIALDAGLTITYPLSGLENGTTYYATVVPYAASRVYAVVTAYYAPGAPDKESDDSNQLVLDVGSKLYGNPSNEISDAPELIEPQPNLRNKGCFIATAAYGSYSAPEVLLLRRFRDAYLMPHAGGRAFVAWYYRTGPAAATFVNAHPWLKPLVRILLAPAIGGAFLLIEATPPMRTAVILFIGLLLLQLYLHKKNRQPSSGEPL